MALLTLFILYSIAPRKQVLSSMTVLGEVSIIGNIIKEYELVDALHRCVWVVATVSNNIGR